MKQRGLLYCKWNRNYILVKCPCVSYLCFKKVIVINVTCKIAEERVEIQEIKTQIRGSNLLKELIPIS